LGTKFDTKTGTSGNRVTVVRKGRKRTRFENFGAKNEIENAKNDIRNSGAEKDLENTQTEIKTFGAKNETEIGETGNSRPEILIGKQSDPRQTLSDFKTTLVPSRFEAPTKSTPVRVATKNRGDETQAETSPSKKSSNK